MILNIKDLQDFANKEFLENYFSYQRRLCIVYELRTGDVVGIYDIQSIKMPNKHESSFIGIKGREVSSILNKLATVPTLNWQYYFNEDIERIKVQSVNYSDNMFGCTLIGEF